MMPPAGSWVSVRAPTILSAGTMRVAVNKACYLGLRPLVLRQVRMRGLPSALSHRLHWTRFPFSLRGITKTVARGRFVYYVTDEESIQHMEYLHQHEPFNWLDVQPGMVVLDIGAFEGWYTLTAATRVGPAGLVVALEPHPISYIGLLRNIGLNQLANVIALPMCAWETDGTLRLNHEDRRVWVNAAPDGRGSSRSAVSLDALCRGLGLERVDFVKMDVEGAERRVLAGSREMLRLYRPRLFVEIHGSLLEIERHLEESGYRVALCQASGIEPERGWHGWVLAEPRA